MASFTRKAFLATPAVVLIMMLNTDIGKDYLRRLSSKCIQNIYANSATIVNIPEVPPITNKVYVPAYIALCQNLINEELGVYKAASPPASGGSNSKETDNRRLDSSVGGTVEEVVHVAEQAATCSDWSSPHQSMMDIVSAMIVTRFTPYVRYRHSCDRTRSYDSSTVGFDHSTIQQTVSTPTMAVQSGVGNATFIYQQCRRCLMYFNPQVESVRVGSKAHHHCFAWPDVPTKNKNVNNIPSSPTGSNIAPLSMVIKPLLQRYYHSALQFSTVTDAPPQEQQSGVVIYLDQTSLGINYTAYLSYLPPKPSSITVLGGPLCSTAYLSTGQLCSTYGQELATYLSTQYSLTNTGFSNGPGIIFQMAGSTAGIASRLTLAQLTICAPRTTSCYLPALARASGQSIVLEDPTWNKAIDFFTVAGSQGKVKVSLLSSSQIPRLTTVTPPKNPCGNSMCSKKFFDVNVAVNDEGYPVNVAVPTMPTDEVIAKTTDQGIVKLTNQMVGPFAANPDVSSHIIELVPSAQQVQAALSGKQPLVVNVRLPNGWGFTGPSGELSLDSHLNFTRAVFDLNYLNAMNTFRVDSIVRIQQNYQQAFFRRNNAAIPQTFEIKCPITTTSKDNNSKDNRRMVAVDHRSFKFGADLKRICADAAVVTSS